MKKELEYFRRVKVPGFLSIMLFLLACTSPLEKAYSEQELTKYSQRLRNAQTPLNETELLEGVLFRACIDTMPYDNECDTQREEIIGPDLLADATMLVTYNTPSGNQTEVVSPQWDDGNAGLFFELDQQTVAGLSFSGELFMSLAITPLNPGSEELQLYCQSQDWPNDSEWISIIHPQTKAPIDVLLYEMIWSKAHCPPTIIEL